MNRELRCELPILGDENKRKALFDEFGTVCIRIQNSATKSRLEVDILVPNTVICGETPLSEQTPVHVRFHGGGFFTGAPLYKPWWGYHVRDLFLDAGAVTLSPRYRKMPDVHGKEILEDVDTFWAWYQGDEFSKDLSNAFIDLGAQKFNCMVQINKSQLLISGESAGGFLAAYSWLPQPSLQINALYMQYPMLCQYTRNAGNPYRGRAISKEDVQKLAKKHLRDIEKLEKAGQLQSRTASDPPEGMDMAYVFSSAKKTVNGKRISPWEYWFRELDILQRLDRIAANDTRYPRPSYCPDTFISHGDQDTNCPLKDTSKPYQEKVLRMFPNAKVHIEVRADAAHAFDYDIDIKDKGTEWLLALYENIKEAWLKPAGE
ncbi:alpha/beta-hydrolase [Westerdykella ornata]|uniref:Alpha/beta-hydrolase n=1 Tax=Westerdykella ornata TaxID=318751 RepID=A0A6A6JJ68_WESOR|nr:alpha/beta-hydrolase [Westerdykella ornata]KAF2276502.1 alpha/beta-hydrolase [Westerdykella ornata]